MVENMVLSLSGQIHLGQFCQSSLKHLCPKSDTAPKRCIFLSNPQNSKGNLWSNPSETRLGDSPIILKESPLAYEFHLESLPVINRTYDEDYSYAGLLIKLKRKSFGQLLSGYYYPTASFAILSLISFLISPDQVYTMESNPNHPFGRLWSKLGVL